jgi:hypothetical protein
MKRVLRYLRITFSATCLIACVLLIVLWVRSYSWTEKVLWRYNPPHVVRITWSGAQIRIEIDEAQNQRAYSTIGDFIIDEPDYAFEPYTGRPTPHYDYVMHEFDSKSAVPIAGCLLLAACVMAVPWIAWPTRFSLSALLLATTLVAMVLAVIVWLSR